MTALKTSLRSASSYTALKKIIVNEPFKQRLAVAEMFLGFMVLLIVDHDKNIVDRVALSATELADNTLAVSVKPFEDIKIPLDDPDNIILKAIKNSKPYDTTDWYYTFTPALTGPQARINQASAGIAYTAIYPLTGFANGGALSFSYYQYGDRIGAEQKDFMTAYTKIVSDVLVEKFSTDS